MTTPPVTATAIAPTRLVELRAEALAKVTRFTDPRACHAAIVVLRRRGELWATEVCGRPLERRSRMFPSLPWLNAGEEYLLAAADLEEDRARFDAIVAGQ